ncbi:hypothetical protein CF336_g7362 [Tilletia laevis]|nr:hypothetical protein CF336_g7362 [Tilletia laevis]
MPRQQGGGTRLQDLTESERATVDHFQTWVEVDGTERVYSGFSKSAKKLQKNIDILSKKRALSLVKLVTGVEENTYDMCVNSCIAYIGPNAGLDRCPHVRDGEICGEPRFDQNGKPRRKYITLPILPRIRAKFKSGMTSTYLHERGQESRDTFGTAQHVFQDWPDGEIHQHFLRNGLFDDPRYDLLMLSTDGAQMLNKADSDGWIVLLISLNSPLSSRFKRSDTFVSTIIPGPKSPGDIDSFLWPIMQELARAALGYWVWDEEKREWFLWRAWLVAGCADQPGSTKINGLTGYQGYSGCKSCLMVANYPKSKQVVGYFPLRTVGREVETSWGRRRRQRNINRPASYDAYDLPLRTDESFAQGLKELSEALTEADRSEIQRRTGVVQLPLLAFSPCFIHPSFFPPDIFHLFGSNISSIIWSTLNENLPGDAFSFTGEQILLFGQFVEDAGIDLPSCFAASPPRNPVKHAANYKFHEWSSMTYYYLLPFLLSIGAPIALVEMLGHLVQGVRLTMSNSGISTQQLSAIQEHFAQFVRAWEDLYVCDDLSKLHRSSYVFRSRLNAFARC